jgi:hypothetical protein
LAGLARAGDLNDLDFDTGAGWFERRQLNSS